MTKEAPWFLEERGYAFASLVLTKGNDVAVRPYAGHDIAIDLLVEVLKDGKSTTRFFGVQMAAYLDLPPVHEADKRALSHSRRDPFEAALPLCMFVIGVRKPEGLYRWVVEPVVDDGQALLCPLLETNWQALDERGVNCLIGQVNAYYDVANKVSTRKPRGHHSKAGS